MRKKIVAANWKMNMTMDTAKALAAGVVGGVRTSYTGNASVILAPPYPFLASVQKILSEYTRISVAAQNIHQEEKGAYTGEVSASMLTSLGVSHCIVGHSERRKYFNEGNELLSKKLGVALEHGLIPIYCIGETLAQREAGNTLDVVREQMEVGAFGFDAEAFSKLIIAYEPVWAIGTGVTATPEQAQEVHAFIRQLVAERYGEEIANQLPILYGGSVKPHNAKELFNQADIDGGLVGGASLKVKDFIAIIQSA